ncbi:unnamed protein product [Arabis nemorensis]|uniref:Uncharacterized protein n=1 Tax=Arabis nemorensis TaxID=586526 RepID=A0A565BCG4_9BRAS|nr:unnamed protein product [Arabis nemorensis]
MSIDGNRLAIPETGGPKANEYVFPDPKENSPRTGSEKIDNGGEAKLVGEDLCRGSYEGVENESFTWILYGCGLHSVDCL